MKNLLLPAFLLISISLSAVAEDEFIPPPIDADWYLEIGGDPYLGVSQADNTNIDFDAGLSWSLGGVCGFDPKNAFKDEFENAKDSIANLGKDVLSSAAPLMSSALLSEIRDLNPGLYDTITKGIFDAKNSISASVKNCQQMQSDISDGKSPTDGWIKINQRDAWAKAAASGDSPTETEDDINKNKSGDEGIEWVDGRAGGRGQPPIKVIGDTVEVGYEHWKTRDDNSALITVFPTKEDASEWVTATVGEQTRQLCTGCTSLTTAKGQGLDVHITEHRKEAIKTLDAMLAKGEVTREDINDLSSPKMGFVLGEHTLRSLMLLPNGERQLLTQRLASDVALTKTLAQALVARQLFITGAQDPNIQNNGEAIAEIEKRKKLLDDAIDNVLFERRLRAEVVTQTAKTITDRHAVLSTGNTDAGTPVNNTPVLKNGAISSE